MKGLTQSETTNRQGRPAADLYAQPAPAASNFRIRELPLGQHGQRRLQFTDQSVWVGLWLYPRRDFWAENPFSRHLVPVQQRAVG